jgi:hypothetical protein
VVERPGSPGQQRFEPLIGGHAAEGFPSTRDASVRPEPILPDRPDGP